MIFYSSIQSSFTKNAEANIDKKFMEFFLHGDYELISTIPFSVKQHILLFLDSNSINNFLVRILNLNVNIFIFVILSSALFVKFFFATVITVACAAILLTAQTIFFKYKTREINTKIISASKEYNSSTNEALQNTKSIKILNCEDFFLKKHLISLNLYTKASRDLLFYGLIPPYITEPFVITTLLILLSIILVQNRQDPTVLVASYALIVTAIFRLTPIISRIQVNVTGVNSALPQVAELISYYEKFKLNNFHPQTEPITNFNNSIEFRNVGFSYNDNEVLKNINFTINKGDFIGIVGESGVGKTTLADILAGLLTIQKGEFYVDGYLISTKKFPRLKIGYIPQSYDIIQASIRENVAFGAFEIDDLKVVNALKKAHLYDFIVDTYKDGIYARPFANSTGLSQGQKQRLAIARALYFDFDIIILDEATSSLDLKTENKICETLKELSSKKTIIAIAHRLSTIKNSDRIFFMKDSTINEIGTFENLSITNKEFQQLIKLNNTSPIN
jgi:ATP-binding cassette subfamily C protein